MEILYVVRPRTPKAKKLVIAKINKITDTKTIKIRNTNKQKNGHSSFHLHKCIYCKYSKVRLALCIINQIQID